MLLCVMKIKRPQLTLKQWGNGYLFIGKSPDGDENTIYNTIKEDGSTDVEQMVSLLWDVVEFFHEHGDRHDKERIFIGIRQGDKYEPTRRTGKI